MKLEIVSKHDNRNKTTSKKNLRMIMLANGDVIVIFLIYGQLSPIQKPYFGSIFCVTHIFINSRLLS